MKKATTKQEFVSTILNEMQDQIKIIFAKPYNGANLDLHDICSALPYLYEISSTGKSVCKNYEVYETLREYESMFDNFSFAYDFEESVISIEEN